MPAPLITVRTRRIDDASPLPPGRSPACCWLRDGDGLTGEGQSLRMTFHGPRAFEDAAAWWADVCASADIDDPLGMPGTGPVAFGAFPFSPDSPAGGILQVPRTIRGRRDGVSWITEIDATQHGAAPGHNGGTTTSGPLPDVIDERGVGAERTDWPGIVARAIAQLQGPDLEKVVLARAVDVQAADAWPITSLVRRLLSQYPDTWTFCVDGLVGATPEMLIEARGGRFASRVLAGTARRMDDPARDADSATSLASSEKDRAEHEFAVQSVREALAQVGAQLATEDGPTVLTLPNVHHLCTDVAGDLAGTDALVATGALHPTAAVCGTPRGRAAEIIRELEPVDRGRYAGPVGWCDAQGNADWGLALRCGQVTTTRTFGDTVRLFAGGGIVAASNPDAETAETDLKLQPMRAALGLDT